MARLLHVSRSGYYRWVATLKQEPSQRAKAEQVLDAKVRKTHEDSDQVYGAPRIAHQLAQEGMHVNVKTVAKSMRRQGLEGISPRSFKPVTTIQGECVHHIHDLVQRRWDTGELNKVWISDITYLRTRQGWVYLCVVRDACSRRVIGWAMDSKQTTDLVERALVMAATLRGTPADNVVFHADRGCQFTSEQMYQCCEKLGIRRSAGRTGVCFDNAMAESFWSTLKHEYYYRHTWLTRKQAIRGVAEWIETVYNRRRLHSSLDYIPPVTFERLYLEKHQDLQATNTAA